MLYDTPSLLLAVPTVARRTYEEPCQSGVQGTTLALRTPDRPRVPLAEVGGRGL
jgi:hypothetical protein